MRQQNILFVHDDHDNNLFAKADCGASQRSTCMIRALARNGHVDVVSFVDETISNLPNVDVVFSGHIDGELYPEGRKCDDRIAKFLGLFERNPYAFYPENKQKSAIVESFVATGDYDLIVVHFFYQACDCGLLKYANRLVIDVDDDPKDKVLMLQDKVRTWRKRMYHRIYANRVEKVVKSTLGTVYKSFYSSPNNSYPNAVFLPNISSFTANKDSIFAPQTHRILVVGLFLYYPNAEGLRHFVSHVFPQVRKQIADAELDVVGRMDDELKSFCKSVDGVNVRGWVEDLKEAYWNCICVIVPIYRGAGTCIKLVEAMALGKAVVTTPAGKRGLHPDFHEGIDYLSANSDDEFAKNVIRLLSDEELNRMMGQNALRKTQLYYSEESFGKVIDSALFSGK